MRRRLLLPLAFLLACVFAGAIIENAATADEPAFVPLFPAEGIPLGWSVRTWNDVAIPAEEGIHWTVKDGVLHGSPDRGTWLMSEKEYGDFELTFEFELGPLGNSGLALRAPLRGDPAFDGMELQMADLRYNPEARPSELTGGIYRAVAPAEQVYRPTEWNVYRIELRGDKLRATLNDVTIHDLDLSQRTESTARHDDSEAPALKDRPRRGHLGFQELSRGDERVRIRNARIRIFDEP